MILKMNQEIKNYKRFKLGKWKKNVSWLHVDNEPVVQKRQQVKDQQFYLPVSVAYLAFPSSSQEHHPRYEEKQRKRKEKEEKEILKDEFSSRTDPSIFKSIAPELLDWSN